MTAVRALSRQAPSRQAPSRQGDVGRPVRLRLVRPLPGRELGWTATIALCVIGLFGALVVSVAIQGQRIALQEEADRVTSRTAEARDRNRQLRIDLVQAESPERVLAGARSAGMVEPGPVAMIPAASASDAVATTTVPTATAPTRPASSGPRSTPTTAPRRSVATAVTTPKGAVSKGAAAPKAATPNASIRKAGMSRAPTSVPVRTSAGASR